MRLYFSGVAGASEFRMLESAGVEHLLVDPFDFKHIKPGRAHIVLDSGAYRSYKRGVELDLDVIGDARASQENWERLRRLEIEDDPPFIPVFQWGSDRGDLARYLDEAPVVGIGGLVTLMREK